MCVIKFDVKAGAWNVDQFYRWTAEYLKWLWYSEDINLPVLALKALRQVLEYDAQVKF